MRYIIYNNKRQVNGLSLIVIICVSVYLNGELGSRAITL